MLRSLVLALIFGSCAGAAMWPQQLGKYRLKDVGGEEHPSGANAGWDEYGQQAIEQANYGTFIPTAIRFKDTTGAYAASLEPSGTRCTRIGNYLVNCSGCPKDFLALAEKALPNVSHAPVSVLPNYLPEKGRLPNSERYIMGPIGLHNDLPQISESAVDLQFGAEAAVARYRLPKGEVTLAIFSYPTLEMARQQAPAYEKTPGIVVKRSGALVALVAPATADKAIDPAEAQKLLAQINYQASFSWNEPLPIVVKPETAAQMILGIITLAGIVLGFCLASGLAFGAIRVIARKFGYSSADESLTTLSLSGK
ncbi:MAG TPA: hypothetical protein VMH05_25190 [Bryobacteraceae bacterium]|nr:hypothetical protein [Bryobacteraceae bacterium]